MMIKLGCLLMLSPLGGPNHGKSAQPMMGMIMQEP